jgi:hypothetical protein
VLGRIGRATRLVRPLLTVSTLCASSWCLATALATAGVSTQPTSSITLEWTAPGDDAGIGLASRYDLRFSVEPITAANFGLASLVGNPPAPVRAGMRQRVQVDGLMPDTHYYFGLKTRDESGNWSPLSNVVARTSPDPMKTPLATRLELGPPSPNPARNHTLIRLALPVATNVRVDVFDAGGRWMRTLLAERLLAGVTPIHWSLGDSNGRPLTSGIYWIRGVLGSEVRLQRLVVVR